MQNYENIEIIILDDGSDKEVKRDEHWPPMVKLFRSDKPSGSGEAFNKGIAHATGDVIILCCADDLFTNSFVVSDIVNMFERDQRVGHVTRFYHQFIDGDRQPVRAWRCIDSIELSNNPSGLAYRRSAIGACKLSNLMFVEAPSLTACVLEEGWKWDYLEYDSVAVRIHNSTARSKDYYLKMWTSSPVESWSVIGGLSIQRDFTSLIQIANYFTKEALYKEIGNFIRLKPINLINPAFWFFCIVSVITPRCLLLKIPDFYRRHIGCRITKELKRNA